MGSFSFRASFIVLTGLSFHALGNLVVYPTRAVLSDSERVVTLALRHTGTTPETYKLKLVFYRMQPDGSMEEVASPKPDERPALKMFRFSPRKTTLTPNLEQVVRIMLAAKGSLSEGDYRAHIHFEPVTEEKDKDENESRKAASDTTEVKMQLKAKVAVAIPVIYRKGKPTFQVSLTNPKVDRPKKGPATVSFDMLSKGAAFPYGDFIVHFTPQEGGAATQVGLLRGVASYLPKRQVSFELNSPEGKALSGGELTIQFRNPDAPAEEKPFAEVATTL